ncbi:methyltransferase type 12 [Candidatus Vecturithrix granuli]|uniref:Methyltransferase type 12 n=1 Tax=Vecturithrix granuli TaxID=1499967 RepID=A0A081C7V8_VECG1|nr:methyltransferase type 12 [Candidatus Vecturithrix granuli]
MNNTQCPICKKYTLAEILKTDGSVSSDGVFQPFSISLTTCEFCGNAHILQDAGMLQHIQKFYQQEYAFLLSSEEEEPCEITEHTARKYSESLVSFFSAYIDCAVHHRILDVGAGKGNFLTALHKKYPSIEKHAIEPGPAYKHLVKHPFLKSAQKNFFDPSFFNEKFDLVSLSFVLEHVSSPVEFLRSIKQVLTDKHSLVLVEVPNFSHNKSDLLTFDHLFKYTETSFENLVFCSGFSIVARQVDPKRVPMQFVIQPDIKRSIIARSEFQTFMNAHEYLQFVTSEANKISTDHIAIYGQGLLLPYFLGTAVIKLKNIKCIIDDNPLYHHTLYRGVIPIVSLDEFSKDLHFEVSAILLAMNDCYHENVLSKLQSKNLNIPIYGQWGSI